MNNIHFAEKIFRIVCLFALSLFMSTLVTAQVTLKPPSNLQAKLNSQNGKVTLTWNSANGFYTDFNDGTAPGWVPVNGLWSVSGGAYNCTTTSGAVHTSAHENGLSAFSYEVKLRKNSGNTFNYGLVFNGTPDTLSPDKDWSNCYVFCISTDGSFNFWKYVNTSDISISGWTSTSAIIQGFGSWNILKVNYNAGNIDLFINGVAVGSFYDTSLPGGKLGLKLYDSNLGAAADYDYVSLNPISKNYTFNKITQKEFRPVTKGFPNDGPANNKMIGYEKTPVSAPDYSAKIKLDPTFKYFNIYRDNIFIDTTSQSQFVNTLPGYGLYSYKVSAVYLEGESAPAGPVSVNYQPLPFMTVNPLNLQADIIGDTTKTVSFYIKNSGSADLTFNISEISIINKSIASYSGNDGPRFPGRKFNHQTIVQLSNSAISSDPVLWLDEAPLSGTISPGDSTQVLVTFNAGGLASGNYLAKIMVAGNDPQNPQVYVNATLNKLVENLTTIDNENNLMQGIPDNDLDVFLYNSDPAAPIEFNIFINNTSINTAQLNILAFDVDFSSGEKDSVVLNGHFVGFLTGTDGAWSTSLFNVDPRWINPGPAGKNTVQVFIDVLNLDYGMTVDWGQLVINGITGNAKFRYVELDKKSYKPGDYVTINGEADADPALFVLVETNILDPNNQVIASTSRTFTATKGNEPYQEMLMVPYGAPEGIYNVRSIIYDATSYVLQDQNYTSFIVEIQKPVISCSPDSFHVSLVKNDSSVAILKIGNNGNADLSYNINIVSTLTKPNVNINRTGLKDNETCRNPIKAAINSNSFPLPFFDGFENGNYNNWTAGSDLGIREVTTATAAEGSYSFHYQKTGAVNHFQGISAYLESGSRPSNVSFYIRAGQTNASTGYVVLLDPNGYEAIWFFAKNTGYLYVNGDVGGNITFAYNALQWYYVQFKNLDWVNKKFDYYVNGALVQSNIPFRNPSSVSQVGSVQLYNYDPGDAWWDAISIDGINSNWLSANPNAGTISPGNNQDITVKIITSKLVVGNYNGGIIIQSNDPLTPAITIPVSLTVTQGTPVELTSFTSGISGQNVILKWTTATEKNNMGFDVERNSGSAWTKVGYLKGNGTSTLPNQYEFTDNSLKINKGNIKYRLLQKDFDGTVKYSNEITATVDFVPVDFSLSQNFPNPFNPATVIKYALPLESNVSITFFNSLGECVRKINEGTKQPGYYELNFNSSGLTSGVYFYRIEANSISGKNNFASTKKMLLLK